MLEALQHSSSAFVTLTYSDENLPRILGKSDTLATLQSVDLQLFLKRLRKRIQPNRIRFYAVGEYGDDTFRPHYHVALFGFVPCIYGSGINHRSSTHSCTCDSCRVIDQAWGLGRISNDVLEPASAKYICGYVLKKLTRTDDPRLEGRWPEFARMSNRPGIGKDAMQLVAETLKHYDLHTSLEDVPSSLRHGRKLYPLGRYLKHKLRLALGREEGTPAEVIYALAKEMRFLFERARADEEHPSAKDHIIEEYRQQVRNLEAKAAIYKGRKSL